MPIDDALEEIKKADELKKLDEEKKQKEKELEEQRKIAEEEKIRREKELEEDKQIKANLNAKLHSLVEKVKETPFDKQDAAIYAHLDKLLQSWPETPKDEIDECVIAFITQPDFIEAYKNALMIKNIDDRYDYVIMRAFISGAKDMSILNHEFALRLAPLGLSLICPYMKKDEKSIVGNKCMIEIPHSGISASCNGTAYKRCVIFNDTVPKFISGEIPYVNPPKTHAAPKIVVSEQERERIEDKIEAETEKYWRRED